MLALPGIRHLLRHGLRPLAPLLPDSLLRHVPVVGHVTVSVPGAARFRMEAVAGDQIASLLHWRGLEHYEAGTVRVLRALLPGARAFVDVGANTGIYSLLAAVVEPACEVWAFEPVPAVRAALERNVALNRTGRIHVESAALGDHEGEAVLHVPPGPMPTSASLIAGFRPGAAALSVPLTTLDAFASRREVPRVDLLKVDAEGSDAEVLRGARAVLARDRPLIIAEVLHALSERGIEAALGSLGYRYLWIRASGVVPQSSLAGDPDYRDLNHLLVPEERLAETMRRLGAAIVDARPGRG